MGTALALVTAIDVDTIPAVEYDDFSVDSSPDGMFSITCVYLKNNIFSSNQGWHCTSFSHCDVDTSPAVMYDFSVDGNPDGMFSIT